MLPMTVPGVLQLHQPFNGGSLVALPKEGLVPREMTPVAVDPERIRSAWAGRISGCQLGKAVEVLSIRQGHEGLTSYLREAGALPLRDYVPLVAGTIVELTGRESCRGELSRSEPDDDINYTVLALMLLERCGLELSTEEVARAWLRLLPAASTWTAERFAYRTLLERANDLFAYGMPPGFDLAECARNEYSEWIGAQIRADIYGWVCPGRPVLAADLARRDAALSHTGDGVHGAAFVAALGAAIPAARSLEEAVDVAYDQIPSGTGVSEAISFARSLAGADDAVELIHERYAGLSPVHSVNNLALVVWALLSRQHDYSAAIGDVVAAGWDTDCNGATVGGLWGLTGRSIPEHWTAPWQEWVAVTLAGVGELDLDDLVTRTVAVAERISAATS
jgi:ADP-ribosylglycohydrolase